jgi:hypothetical protein
VKVFLMNLIQELHTFCCTSQIRRRFEGGGRSLEAGVRAGVWAGGWAGVWGLGKLRNGVELEKVSMNFFYLRLLKSEKLSSESCWMGIVFVARRSLNARFRVRTFEERVGISSAQSNCRSRSEPSSERTSALLSAHSEDTQNASLRYLRISNCDYPTAAPSCVFHSSSVATLARYCDFLCVVAKARLESSLDVHHIALWIFKVSVSFERYHLHNV